MYIKHHIIVNSRKNHTVHESNYMCIKLYNFQFRSEFEIATTTHICNKVTLQKDNFGKSFIHSKKTFVKLQMCIFHVGTFRWYFEWHPIFVTYPISRKICLYCALTLSRGWRWPAAGGIPRASKLYSLNVLVFHDPLQGRRSIYIYN